MPRPRPACGTDGGYLAHRRRGEEACDPCKAAHAATGASHRHAHGATPREKGPEHGTRPAYERERRAHNAGKGPEPCDECREAYRVWRDEQRHPTPDPTPTPDTTEVSV